MQPYMTLTRQGKVRRLRKLALNALAQYDLEVSNLRLVGAFTNTVFRVWGQFRNPPDTGFGREGNSSYILRICFLRVALPFRLSFRYY